jgi:hypothetical protein
MKITKARLRQIIKEELSNMNRQRRISRTRRSRRSLFENDMESKISGIRAGRLEQGADEEYEDMIFDQLNDIFNQNISKQEKEKEIERLLSRSGMGDVFQQLFGREPEGYDDLSYTPLQGSYEEPEDDDLSYFPL